MPKYILLTLILLFRFSYSESHSSFDYIFPIPASDYLPKETQLIFRFKNVKPGQIGNLNTFVTVTGAESGPVTGRTIISSDQKTIIYKPNTDFIFGEQVEVHLTPVITGMEIDTTYYFTIAPEPPPLPLIPEDEWSEESSGLNKSSDNEKTLLSSPIVRNGISIPSDFPWVNITVNDNPDTGYIFINNWSNPYYMMILDNSGFPIWYLKTSDRRRDFKVQKDGRLTMLARNIAYRSSHIALDSTYTLVDTFYVPAPYSIDEHELQVLPSGHYFVIGTESRYYDLRDSVETEISNTRVIGNHVIEMDAEDNPVLIWRCWDHLDITDAIGVGFDRFSTIEYTHMNAIEIDHDGHILVSSRNLAEVTKINRQTGQIIWRLGGRNNYFTWIDYDSMSWQHDIRVLDNGHYTVFDNGNRRPEARATWSRALELDLDLENMTATNVWEYRETPDIYTRYLGNTQRLPNGNTLINWAVIGAPKLMEIRPDGSKEFELDFARSADCYRTFRFPWKGKAAVPYLLAESGSDRVVLLFNKFGDPDVSVYRIYGGVESNPQEVVATTSDPYYQFFDFESQQVHFFRVTAINAEGDESGFSNQIQVVPPIIDYGQNILLNGDFSSGFDHWQWQIDSSRAQATKVISDSGELHIQISNGGTDFRHIQVSYPYIQLIQGEIYVFEFDACADQNRAIEANLVQVQSPYMNYSMKNYTELTSDLVHISWTFTMQEPSDYSAAIKFNLGYENHDVYIDNVSLKKVVSSLEDNQVPVPEEFALHNNYPNPFNPTTTIAYQLPEHCHVTITVYNLLGERVEELIDHPQMPGKYQVKFNAAGISSGVYLYEMKARSIHGGSRFAKVKKMIILK